MTTSRYDASHTCLVSSKYPSPTTASPTIPTAADGIMLVVYHPHPDTGSDEKLALLGSMVASA